MFGVDAKMDEIFVDCFKANGCKKFAHRLALNHNMCFSPKLLKFLQDEHGFTVCITIYYSFFEISTRTMQTDMPIGWHKHK